MVAAVFLATGVGLAAPPAPGQHFDCTDGGTSSCATDDTGCVSNTIGHLRCSSKIGKLFAKAVYGTIICHLKQADMRFKGASETGAGSSEENCEDNPGNSAKGKLDAGLSKLIASGLCDPVQLANAAAEEAILFGPGPLSLDGQNGNVYCDSSSGALIGDDDTGWVASTASMFKCEAAVAKALGKLVVSGIKCHDKMNSSFFKGRDFAEESCEEIDPLTPTRGALAKFNQVRDQLVALGICPPCLDGASQDAQAGNALSQLDLANQIAYPCTLGP
jgi:hypothetical protein